VIVDDRMVNVLREKIGIFLIFMLLIIIVMVVIMLLSSPLRRAEEQIRFDLFNIMPVGTGFEEVIRIVEDTDGWSIGGAGLVDAGIIVGPRGPSIGYPLDDEEIIGEMSVRVLIGRYYAFFFIETHVYAFIAFDENDRLTEIAIKKSANVL